jgi:PAS domain S-box-containing protein
MRPGPEVTDLRDPPRRPASGDQPSLDVLENATIAIHSVDEHGIILWANRAELEMLGYDRDDYVGRSIADFHVDRAVVADMLARLAGGEDLRDREVRLRAKDGSIKHALVNSSVYRKDGRFVHTRAFTLDITQRRAAELAFEEQDRRLAAITDALPVLVSFVDADLRYRFVNANYERWFGRSKSELIGERLDELLGENAYAAVSHHVQRALAGEPVTYESRVPYRYGGTRWIEATYLPQHGDDGRVVGFIVLVGDIEERKSQERRRAREAERAQRLLKVTAAIAGAVTHDQVFEALVDHAAEALDASSAALWLVDDISATARLVRARGYSDDTLQRFASVRLDFAPAFPALDAIRTGQPLWFASRAALFDSYPHLRSVASPDREYRVACLPLRAHGRVLGSLGLTIDGEQDGDDEREFAQIVATYASQAVERLRLLESERRSHQENLAARSRAEQLYRFAQSVVDADRIEVVYEAALASIDAALGAERTAILTFDREGVMRFRASHGLSQAYRDAVEGHSPWPRDAVAPEPVLVPDVAADPSISQFQSLFQTERIGALAFVPLVASGQLLGKFMVYYEHPHEFATHEIETAVAVANHLGSVITRFAAVAKLEDTIRSNELFAGALAHDLRNPLSAVLTGAQMLLMRQPGGGVEEQALARIVSSGQRMCTMIDQLLDFTRARSGGGIDVDPQQTDLGEVCRQAIGELELAHPGWIIRYDSHGDLSGTWDAVRIVQVVSNLVANAGQHGKAGGLITARVDGSRADRIRLEVHNEGAIPPSLLPDLFDPFRGTQHHASGSRGLGLGLFIVREIVGAHGGTVDVASSDSAGTTFVVELPRRATTRNTKEEAKATPSAESSGSRIANTQTTILVVDDDDDVRDALVETLVERGFIVESADNGAAALELLRRSPTPPSVILLDLMMPVLDGYGFLEEQRGDPTLAAIPVVIVTAGHGVDRKRLGASTLVLPKPIRLPQLLSTLRQFDVSEGGER